MTKEEQAHLFTRFHNRKSGGKETGIGLGLYICKYMVDKHGGHIKAESTENRGTTMTFFLPLQ